MNNQIYRQHILSLQSVFKGANRYLSVAIATTSLLTLSNSTNAIGTAGDVKSSQISDYLNERSSYNYHREEPELSGWAISFDNDALVPSTRDQDYTYGTSVTIAGKSTRNYLLSLNRPLSWVNQWLGVGNGGEAIGHSIEVGIYGFTPEDKTEPAPLSDDRPYASIVYWSSSQELTAASSNSVWHSTLTVGALGLEIAGDIQNEVHRVTSSRPANGWSNQISDGGELTARYSLAKQTLWDVGHPKLELKTTTQASLGYLTELSWGASLRVGNIRSRWQSYRPELTSYGEQSNQSVDNQRVSESYFSLGAALKSRVYNAFLQGQFRDSVVEYDNDELNNFIVEAWAGYTRSFGKGYRVSYLLRGHTSEVRDGDGDRNVVWGGLTVSKVY